MKQSFLFIVCFGVATFVSAASQAPPKPATKPGGIRPATTPTATAPEAKPEQSASDLVEQGKTLYKKANFPQALAKFEAALKLEPERDEALM